MKCQILFSGKSKKKNKKQKKMSSEFFILHAKHQTVKSVP